MNDHAIPMRRCLQLAANAAGYVAPNPMVGAVLVQSGQVLAEGWHHSYGGAHAEVECLRAYGDGPVPQDAIMYVNLEPCSHHGKTPPCVDLLIERGVKRLVIGSPDPNPVVHKKGLARARAAGIEVIEDVLRDECRWFNRRFFSGHTAQRPYIVLKWARSADGFLDDHGRTVRISSPTTDVLVHRWRGQEQAILVGGRTVINDDPQLTVRLVDGRSPIRIIMDRRGLVPESARVFDDAAPSLLVTETEDGACPVGMILNPASPALEVAIELLLRKEIGFDIFMSQFDLPPVSSILVEGGATILSAFLASGLWDEARVITGAVSFGDGTRAPVMAGPAVRSMTSGSDRIDLFTNGPVPDSAWAW